MDSCQSGVGVKLAVPVPKLVLGLTHAYSEMTGWILRTLTKSIPLALGRKIRRGVRGGSKMKVHAHPHSPLLSSASQTLRPGMFPETCTGLKYEAIMLDISVHV